MKRRPRIAFVTTIDLTLGTVLRGQLRYLRDAGFDVTTVSAPGPWVPELQAEGFRHRAWSNATRSWSPMADVRALFELVRILRAGRFDLVHTHTPKAGFLGRIAARLAHVPRVVNTVHGFYATPEDPAAKRVPVLALERLAARFSDLELYVSVEDLQWARRVGVAADSKTALVGNGIDLARFDPQVVPASRVAALRSELGIPPEAMVVGTVGRLVEEKGLREFAEAARQVRQSVPGVVFVAVGAPDLDKADAFGEKDMARARADVLFTGWRDDVRDLLAAMDVFVLASRREGLPISALHAAAMARAVVLTDIRGCREIVRDGVDGFLVPARQPDRLAEAIRTLLGDEGLRARLGATARARCLAEFDERRVGAFLVDAYGTLLGPAVTDGAAGSRDLSGGNGAGPHGPSPLQVRRARPGDAGAIARLHREGLPDSFLPTLGDGFLRRLYRALSTDPQAVTLVVENGNGVVGFAAGALSIKGFYRRFALRQGPAALMSAGRRLLRPGVLRRLVETAEYPVLAGDLPDAELVAIAVSPEIRARGVGRTLALGVVRGLAERGADQLKVVAARDNEHANAFYAGLGFTKRRLIAIHRGTPSNVWVIDCRRGSAR